MSYVVSGVPAILVPVVWDRVQPFLAAAILESNGELTEESVYADLASGATILVIIYLDKEIVGAAALRKKTFDSGINTLSVFLLGGKDMNSWIKDAYGVAVQIAKHLDCQSIYCIGRDGWVKVLKDIGFKKQYSVLSINLED